MLSPSPPGTPPGIIMSTTANGDDHHSSPTSSFRSRYSADESSDAAYEEDLRRLRFMSRKRRGVEILLSFAFIVMVGVVARIYLFFVGMRGGSLTGEIQMLSPDDLLLRNESSYSSSSGSSGSTSSSSSSSSSLWGRAWKIRKGGRRRPLPGKETFGLADGDSDGFFAMIPDDEWEGMRHRTRTIIDVQDDTMVRTAEMLTESGANIDSSVWWVDNWKINFECPKVEIIGGKSICDPKRIIYMADDKQRATIGRGGGRGKRKKIQQQQRKECIVYVSGGGRYMEFAHHFLDYSLARMVERHGGTIGEGVVQQQQQQPGVEDLLPCEVHVFTPHGSLDEEQLQQQQRDGLYFHDWGFRPGNKESMGIAVAADNNNATSKAFKTLQETAGELQHHGRLSLLVLDCEACEWDIYPDVAGFDEPFSQVVMQMHGTPFVANDLFRTMQERGYVIFHREEDYAGGGDVYDYSWLHLSSRFFSWKPH